MKKLTGHRQSRHNTEIKQLIEKFARDNNYEYIDCGQMIQVIGKRRIVEVWYKENHQKISVNGGVKYEYYNVIPALMNAFEIY